MKWHIEESGWSNLWDVYDEDGNAFVRDKTLENARLIAAAPDMLEVLKWVNRYLNLEDDLNLKGVQYQIQQVINIAEGE